ncbi:MAG: hypothetical protein A2X61_15900 [Ignavibacteria bacterium GWB2_35_12]|nr:MAG: hypothetical protein A2X61_15900 [Ignavibacteria bacterium GWB2_35_12]OGU87147.1 MAG: hypothetical protein A2220_08275 [Ignavibacteria bacterium RIFOXYA2_FULL_35_10]OGV24682.1 MAG: hypothetical protein A2475_14675 [Ignavibacteria bacterium RIFOXYC2_FULL_35_21]
MKKIYILFLIILLLQSFIFISCNSETSPTVDKIMSEYFPTTIGNWWKYENWVLDSNGLRTKNISVDSVVVENIIYYEGKNSVVLVTYSSRDDTVIKSTNYIAIEGSKLLAYMNLTFSDGDSIPWITAADLDGSEWLMVEKDIINENNQVKNEFYIKISGSKGAVLDFNFKSDILKVQEFMTYYIQRTSTIMPKDTVKTDMESSYQDLYCKGIGQVYSKYMMVKNLGYERQGYETTLIDYYVK